MGDIDGVTYPDSMHECFSSRARPLITPWKNYALLRAFVERREGHAPKRAEHARGGWRAAGAVAIDAAEAVAVAWVERGGAQGEEGRRSGRRHEEVARLEAVGVAWRGTWHAAARWERNYALLRAFVERKGHANVPERHEENGERLGQWLPTQRQRWRAPGWSEEERKVKKVSALSDEEVARLEAVGVVWQPRRAGAA
jgi:hypothetical protein